MLFRQPTQPLFSVKPLTQKLPLPARPMGWLARPIIDRALKLDTLSRDYDIVTQLARAGEQAVEAFDFSLATIEHYGIRIEISEADLAKIPQTGPVLAVSNHPFGGIEGLILLNLLRQARPDVKLMANYLLGLIPEMRKHCVFVNPFGSSQAIRENLRGMKDALAHLKGGHLMGVFPAGEVAALRWGSRGKIQDPRWSAHVAALARKSGATAVPIHIRGSNSTLFQLAGLVHPLLRTMLLPREFLNKKQQTVRIHIGSPIAPTTLSKLNPDHRAIQHLRLRSDLLPYRLRQTAQQRRQGMLSTRLRRGQSPNQLIVAPTPPQEIATELGTLPQERLLVSDKNFRVYTGKAQELPSTLREIGRLREITFRQVGEGSGKAIDLDRFDTEYHHLVLWDSEAQKIAGAYRIGRYQELLTNQSADGLYLQTLFKLDPKLLATHGQETIEMGRSFVCPEYQRGYAPLLNLWKGICTFAYQTGDRYLIGPVSISNDYAKLSKALMVRYLTRPEHRGAWSRFATPRTGFAMRRYGRVGVTRLARQCASIQDLSQLITDLEPDGKGVPILIRQYLSWQAKFLAFNVDPEFNYCLDGLIVVDLPMAPDRMINRYMGKDEAANYRQRLQIESAQPSH